MVAFKNLSGIIVFKGCSGSTGDLKKKIHANRKVGGIDESSSVLFHQFPDFIDFFVPSGCADDYVLASFYASFDVREHAMRGCEIDDGGDVLELFRSQRGATGIFFRARNFDLVLAFARYFCDQGAGLASA